jgi:hypothetical protein
MKPKVLIDQFEDLQEELTALIDGLCAFAFLVSENDITESHAGNEPKMTIMVLTRMAANRINQMNECATSLKEAASK